MEFKNAKEAYLFCYPLSVERDMNTVAELKCFQLIWLKCCYESTFKDVYISKRDRSRIGLPTRSYVRGIEALEQSKLITVDRHNGRLNRISVNIEKIDKKSTGFVLKNGVQP